MESAGVKLLRKNIFPKDANDDDGEEELGGRGGLGGKEEEKGTRTTFAIYNFI